MKIGHFVHKNKKFYGLIEENIVYEINGNIYTEFERNNNKYELDDLKYLPPTSPSKIVAVGLNYKDHAAELKMNIPDEPVIFLKPSTTVIAHNENIIYPSISGRVDYEAELAVVIKKEMYKVKKDEASKYILGYTCANDVTARDLQKKDGQWTRAKSFNTFCPLGPWIYIPLPKDNFDPHNLKIQTKVNGSIKQNSNTSNLIFKIEYLLEFISSIMPLFPGDIVITGTPKGIGPILPGDKIEVIIESIGKLQNFCISEK